MFAKWSNQSHHWSLSALFFGALTLQLGCNRLGLRDSLSNLMDRDSSQIHHVAKHHNQRGLHYFAKGHVGKAETEFQKAIQSDARLAAAHNNLGNMYFSRRELYSAAWEFERAADLAPSAFEPLINLSFVHEEAGQLDEAASYCEQSLSVSPNNPIALGNLARIRIKQDADPIEIHTLLRQLIFFDSRPDWIQWAEELSATKYKMFETPTFPSNDPNKTDWFVPTPVSEYPPVVQPIPEEIPAPNLLIVPPTNPDHPNFDPSTPQ